MAKGQFFPWLKPDHKQKEVKPQISVASYVVDQWRMMAYAGVAIGVIGMVGGLAAGAWAFAKERMPSYTITPIIQPDGWQIETYVDGSDKALNERVVCSVLQHTIVMLRTVAPGKASSLKIATNVFADHAAIRARQELEDLKWYDPLLAQGRTRQVMTDQINCYRTAGNEHAYNIEWVEKLYGRLGALPDGERRKVMSVLTARTGEVPAEIVKWNPWGVFITEYSGVLD